MSKFKKTYKLFIAEFIGTALLLLIGLSVVIFMWGDGTVMARVIPNVPTRRLVTGFLFGCTGCLVTISPVGKISGAHINPAVSLGFWLKGKMKTHAMIGYIISQMLGSIVGCLPLYLWQYKGASVGYGNTTPGYAGVWPAFVGEAVTTACLITLIFVFVGHKKLRNYTPYTMPFLYAFMVWAESALSGCSTNPARSFGPAVISNVFNGFWIYLVAPALGVAVMVVIFKSIRLHKYYHIEAARISYHERHSPDCLKTT